MLFSHILLIDDEDDQEIFLTALREAAQSVVCTAINNAKDSLQKLVSKK